LRVTYHWRFAITATQHLPHMSVTEDGVAHIQFSTFEWTRGDTNGHKLGHQQGHHLHKFGVHWPDRTHKGMGGHENAVRLCPIAVQQGFRSSEGLTRWLPEARLFNQVKAAGMCHGAVLRLSPVVVRFHMGVFSPVGLLSAQHV
jgi:hypothetical protein